MRLWFKVVMVAAMTLAILVALAMVRGVIDERQAHRAQAVASVVAGFGGAQLLAGPVLVVPYVEDVEEDVRDAAGVLHKVTRTRERQWTFFPETLLVDGALAPDTRRRGLHQVRVYQWSGSLRARFDARIPDDGARVRRIGRPWLAHGIADVRGLRELPVFTLDGAALPLSQGLGHADGPGLHARLAAPRAGQRLVFATALALELRGTESFAMLPVARSNDLRLQSSWRHPKFEGLSPQHDIGDDGFRARWQVAALATGAQREYRHAPDSAGQGGGTDGWATSAVSVALIDPVDTYLQAERATKYGVLFVALTFVAFFMFELIRQQPIHPIQYGLVGLAIALFFLLLVSLGEHIPFGFAYLSAAAACIGLIGFYLAAVLGGVLRGAAFAAMLATLYAALYGLLVSEDNALVLGAGLLFVVLAAIMVVTRRVDWYQLSAVARR
ncbi:cell envelope integrity protein CreD [Luteimonas sp. MC1572]|nr:cell envelope integrity protein CreD [Luteimonas sp. MC1572]MBJ6982794.1 cell envelope integrity protein CreD [Luteimonas sp. MC1572]QQO04503.1 cell envelope integrity protein CreD [Luteimonas sp. MC1572]